MQLMLLCSTGGKGLRGILLGPCVNQGQFAVLQTGREEEKVIQRQLVKVQIEVGGD